MFFCRSCTALPFKKKIYYSARAQRPDAAPGAANFKPKFLPVYYLDMFFFPAMSNMPSVSQKLSVYYYVLSL